MFTFHNDTANLTHNIKLEALHNQLSDDCGEKTGCHNKQVSRIYIYTYIYAHLPLASIWSKFHNSMRLAQGHLVAACPSVVVRGTGFILKVLSEHWAYSGALLLPSWSATI